MCIQCIHTCMYIHIRVSVCILYCYMCIHIYTYHIVAYVRGQTARRPPRLGRGAPRLYCCTTSYNHACDIECLYTYMCMYTCVYIHACLSLSLYIYIYQLCVYIYIYIYMYREREGEIILVLVLFCITFI